MRNGALLLVLSMGWLACSPPAVPTPVSEPPRGVGSSSANDAIAPLPSSSSKAIVPAQPSAACQALVTAKPRTPVEADWIMLAPRSPAAPAPQAPVDLEESSFVVSDDGRHGAAWTTEGKRLRLFDLRSGAELPGSGKLGPLHRVELSGDRAIVLLETAAGSELAVVDLPTGEVLRRTPQPSVPDIRIARQGHVYAVTVDGTHTSVRSTKDDRELLRVPTPSGAMHLSTDGTALVTTTGDGKSPCFLEIHRLDGKGKRRVNVGDQCPRPLVVGQRGERIAWVEVDRKDPKLPWYVTLLEKSGVRRRGPKVALTGPTHLSFDDAEERIAITFSSSVAVGRLTDTALSVRPVLAARRVVFAEGGSLVEASADGFYRHEARSSTALLTRRADGGGPLAGPTSLRWYAEDGTLLGGVLASSRFLLPEVHGEELAVITDRGDLSLTRGPAGVALKALVPMHDACSFDHGCVHLAPGLVANLDVSNAHLGDHPTVGLAGPWPDEQKPPRMEAPSVGAAGVATDGTFVQAARGKLAVRNVCVSEAWRTYPLPGDKPRALRACPGFALLETHGRDGLAAVSTTDGASLGTLAWKTGSPLLSCAAARKQLESGTSQSTKP